MIYPDLSYADAIIIVQADLPSLVNQRDSLCSKRFDGIVNNYSHKIINLLALKANSYSSRLRKKRYFRLPNLKTNRTRNYFVYSYADTVDTLINLLKGTSLIHLRIVNE